MYFEGARYVGTALECKGQRRSLAGTLCPTETDLSHGTGIARVRFGLIHPQLFRPREPVRYKGRVLLFHIPIQV